MATVILLKAFFVGFCAASAFGPVFIMAFNRAALEGFFAGLAIALGAGLTDGLLFFLSLRGFWGGVVSSTPVMMALDFIGAVALLGLSVYYWRLEPVEEAYRPECTTGDFLLITVKTFCITVINPSALLFFMFISLKLFDKMIGVSSLSAALCTASALALGSFCSLALVSLGADFVGGALSVKSLKKLFKITAGVLFFAALLLLWDAFALF